MTEPTVFSTPSILTATIKHWQNASYTPPVGDPETTRYLTPSQLTAYLLAAHVDEDRDCATLLTCTLLSGIPAIDLTTAEWAELNFEKCVLQAFSPLSEHDEVHHLNPPATALLRRWSKESGYYSQLIFTRWGEPLDYVHLDEVVERIGCRAGIPSLTIDDLQRNHEVLAVGIALCDVPMPALQACTPSVDQAATPPSITLSCC